MDRLTSIDAGFLAQEREGSHMHIGGLLIFEGPAPSREDFAAHLEARLHLVPRYRQRLSVPRFEMGRPLWVDDPSFQLGYHVRQAALPRPGSIEQLRLLVGRIFSQRLDRSRPLWELWLVEGYEGDKFAIISKTHHALVDGVSGADLTTVLFDLAREPTEVAAPERAWAPEQPPGDAALIGKGVAELAGVPMGLARRGLGVASHPRRSIERAREIAEGLGEVAWGRISPAPETPLNGPIGSHRRTAWVRIPVPELKEVKRALGGTVNDVFLASVSGALHHWLRLRGVRTEGLEIRSAVPLSVRARGDGASLGNQLLILIARLPTYCDDPADRLQIVRESMKDLKASKQALGAEVISSLEEFAPPTLFARASRLHFSTRMYNLLTTNVPGPQFPLYLLGREMLELLPVAFLAPEQRLAIASMSYNGFMAVSLIGDYEQMGDLEALAELIGDEVGALRAVAKSERMASAAPKAAGTELEGRALAYFKDADEVYEFIGKLFADLAVDDELGPKFRKANTIVQYKYSNPDSTITVKMIDGEEGEVDLGETDMEPEVVMTMEADTAHRFWLGKVNVTVALARGQMKAKGPVAKILKLVPLVKPVFPRYRSMLEEKGRTDLVEG